MNLHIPPQQGAKLFRKFRTLFQAAVLKIRLHGQVNSDSVPRTVARVCMHIPRIEHNNATAWLCFYESAHEALLLLWGHPSRMCQQPCLLSRFFLNEIHAQRVHSATLVKCICVSAGTVWRNIWRVEF